jgi:SAM-dependent methyltransferase
MPKYHPDLLGLALQDYLNGTSNGRIKVVSPDFDEDEIPVSYYFRDYDSMPALERNALKYCRGRILDAGAGAGSHSLYLQSQGFDVTAMDISPGACRVASVRGVKKVLNDDVMTTANGGYDTLLMLMNGIGLTSGIQGLKRFINRLPQLLAPQGQCIFDSTNLIYLYQEPDGSVRLNLNGVYYGEIEFRMEYAGFLSESFIWLYVDFDTVEWMAEASGLKAELLEEYENYSFLARIMV